MTTSRPLPLTRRTLFSPSVRTSRNSMSGERELRPERIPPSLQTEMQREPPTYSGPSWRRPRAEPGQAGSQAPRAGGRPGPVACGPGPAQHKAFTPPDQEPRGDPVLTLSSGHRPTGRDMPNNVSTQIRPEVPVTEA